MENFDFAHVYPRHDTNSVKWDSITETYAQTDLLPLWVADMDFKVPSAVEKALVDYARQGIYGYTITPTSLYEAIIAWEETEYAYHLEPEEILFSPGVVPSFALAIQTFTQPGEVVMIHDPIYPPFANMVEINQRKLVRNELIGEAGRFTMDLKKMEQQIIAEKVKMFILCNPHNPGGRVWRKEELKAFGEICRKHHVLVVSDEIHQDLVFKPHQHQSFHTVDPSFADFSLVLTAPTKTFNLAGVKFSTVFIKNPLLRDKFQLMQKQLRQDTMNTFGQIAAETAYRQGKPWLQTLMAYLQANVEETVTFFAEKMPKVNVMIPEATYLIWLDFSAYGLTDEELAQKMLTEAKVVLNSGITYGKQGRQHMRINIACPQTTLQDALERIYQAFE